MGEDIAITLFVALPVVILTVLAIYFVNHYQGTGRAQ